jgi:hypothetical protein
MKQHRESQTLARLWLLVTIALLNGRLKRLFKAPDQTIVLNISLKRSFEFPVGLRESNRGRSLRDHDE